MEAHLSLLKFSLLLQDAAQVVVGRHMFRVQREGLLIQLDCPLGIAHLLHDVSEVVVGICVGRVDDDRFPEPINCLFMLAHAVNDIPHVVVSAGMVRVLLDHLSQLRCSLL